MQLSSKGLATLFELLPQNARREIAKRMIERWRQWGGLEAAASP